jgi:hypothetical protein
MSHLSDDKLEQKVPGTTKRNIRELPGTWMAWAVAEFRGGGNLRRPTEPPAAFSHQVVALPESAP